MKLKLTATAVCANTQLRLGKLLLAGQDGDAACDAAGGTHSLVCATLWLTVVARQNRMTQAWRRAFSRCGEACAFDQHACATGAGSSSRGRCSAPHHSHDRYPR